MFLLFSLFYLVAPSIASLDYSSNHDQVSRQSQQSCGSQTIRHDEEKFLGPYIVHLEKGHAHEDFEQNLRRSQELHYPFTVSSMKVETSIRYDFFFHDTPSTFVWLRLILCYVYLVQCFANDTNSRSQEFNSRIFGTALHKNFMFRWYFQIAISPSSIFDLTVFVDVLD